MFASAAAVTLPSVIEPPMITTSFTSGTMPGSLRTARAMLVSGPTGTSVSWPGMARTISMIRSGAKRVSAVHREAGSSMSPIPFSPVHELGGDEALGQGPRRAPGYGNVAPPGQGHEAQGVLQGLRLRDVAAHHREGPHVHLGRVEGQQDRHRVVRPGIGVDDDRRARDLASASAAKPGRGARSGRGRCTNAAAPAAGTGTATPSPDVASINSRRQSVKCAYPNGRARAESSAASSGRRAGVEPAQRGCAASASSRISLR